MGKEFSVTAIETNIGRWMPTAAYFLMSIWTKTTRRRRFRVVTRASLIITGNFYRRPGLDHTAHLLSWPKASSGKRHMLQNGDEIIIGKTFLKFQVMR